MAASSTATTSLAYFLALNLIFFTLVNACEECSKPKPPPPPACPPPPKAPTPKPPKATCPKDTLKLKVCANVLGVVGIQIGTSPDKQCCPLIDGLVDLDAALCLCTAIRANVLGINLNVPVALSLILQNCRKKLPSGFKCPA